MNNESLWHFYRMNNFQKNSFLRLLRLGTTAFFMLNLVSLPNFFLSRFRFNFYVKILSLSLAILF